MPRWWFNLHPSCSGTGEEDDWKRENVIVNPNEVVSLGAAVQIRPFLLLKPWPHRPFHYYWRRKYQMSYNSLVISDLFSTVFLFIRKYSHEYCLYMLKAMLKQMCVFCSSKCPSMKLALSVKGSCRDVQLSMCCSIRVQPSVHHRSREDCNWMQGTMHPSITGKTELQAWAMKTWKICWGQFLIMIRLYILYKEWCQVDGQSQVNVHLGVFLIVTTISLKSGDLVILFFFLHNRI